MVFPGVMLVIKGFVCIIDCWFAAGSPVTATCTSARTACIPLFPWCLETLLYEFALLL